MTASLAFRAMTVADTDRIAAWMSCDPFWIRYGFGERAVVVRELTVAIDRDDVCIVAEVGAVVAGFAWCVPNGMFARHPYLKRLGVAPEFAKQGIGSRILGHLERVLVNRGAVELYLLVADFNTGAQRFYEQSGYQRIAELPDAGIEGVTELLYRKWLDRMSY
jgi:ribosomal protein S18 acetylase RimI-like enzyme